MEIKTHKVSGKIRYFLVYNPETGEILDNKPYKTSKDALSAYTTKHNYYQHPQLIKGQQKQAIIWWKKHQNLLENIKEIQMEEEIIGQPILDYQLFRISLLEEGHGSNIPLRTLWYYLPEKGEE